MKELLIPRSLSPLAPPQSLCQSSDLTTRLGLLSANFLEPTIAQTLLGPSAKPTAWRELQEQAFLPLGVP